MLTSIYIFFIFLLSFCIRAEIVAYKSTQRLITHQKRALAGYHPEFGKCDLGATCSDACGEDYEQCSSNDAILHCFNKPAGQKCCPGGSGNACNRGYYCTQDSTRRTWCCPDKLDLKACAESFDIGELNTDFSSSTSALPVPTTVVVTAVTTMTATPTKSTHRPCVTGCSPWSNTTAYTRQTNNPDIVYYQGTGCKTELALSLGLMGYIGVLSFMSVIV